MGSKELIKKLGTIKHAGSSTAIGKAYHNFPGYDGSSHVGSVVDRVNMITDNYDVKGKLGLDIGCSVGGVSIELAKRGARMVGVDHDPQSIGVAMHYATKFKINARFFMYDVDLEYTKMIEADFIVWFNHFMWYVKQHGLDSGKSALEYISKKNMTLFFETSFGDGMAGKAMKACGINSEGKVFTLLMSHFKSVKKIGTHTNWRNRPIFMCEN